MDLEPYLIELMEWLQDLNWPGALIVLNRLSEYKGDSFLECHAICLKKSRLLGDDTWESNLYMLLTNRME